jgi:hypothetical protein
LTDVWFGSRPFCPSHGQLPTAFVCLSGLSLLQFDGFQERCKFDCRAAVNGSSSDGKQRGIFLAALPEFARHFQCSGELVVLLQLLTGEVEGGDGFRRAVR